MGVTVTVEYEGDLHCTAVHGPSGDRLPTDAPVDNRGKGEHFSPTDLLGTAMGTCMLTIMGIVARDRNIVLTGAVATVVKEMSEVPRRHISRLTVDFAMPPGLDRRSRALLEAAAAGCPVAASLGPDTEVIVRFRYPD